MWDRIGNEDFLNNSLIYHTWWLRRFYEIYYIWELFVNCKVLCNYGIYKFSVIINSSRIPFDIDLLPIKKSHMQHLLAAIDFKYWGIIAEVLLQWEAKNQEYLFQSRMFKLLLGLP